MIYRYARVSTDGQSVAAQAAALRKHGAGKVFREVASGAKIERAQLRRVLDQVDAGDVLMVTPLDRLARSTRDLLNTVAAITAKESGLRSLGDAWADTTTRADTSKRIRYRRCKLGAGGAFATGSSRRVPSYSTGAERGLRLRPVTGGATTYRAGSWFEVIAGKFIPGFCRDAPEDEEPRPARCNIRTRLGGQPGTASLFPRRPKGMHERTYQHLQSKIVSAEMLAEERLTIFLERDPGDGRAHRH
jgi:hypothetical protein